MFSRIDPRRDRSKAIDRNRRCGCSPGRTSATPSRQHGRLPERSRPPPCLTRPCLADSYRPRSSSIHSRTPAKQSGPAFRSASCSSRGLSLFAFVASSCLSVHDRFVAEVLASPARARTQMRSCERWGRRAHSGPKARPPAPLRWTAPLGRMRSQACLCAWPGDAFRGHGGVTASQQGR